jgi:hypothetical protein
MAGKKSTEVKIETADGAVYRVVGAVDNAMMRRLKRGRMPAAAQPQPWTPFYETYLPVKSNDKVKSGFDQALNLLDQMVTQYRLKHPDWLNRLALRRDGKGIIIVDDFWPIVDINIIESSKRAKVSLSLTDYTDESGIANAKELRTLSDDLAGFLHDELEALREQSDEPADPLPDPAKPTGTELWTQIPDHLWDRQALELWHKGHSCTEIGMKIGQAGKTVRNRLTILRSVYGREIVPTNKDRRKKLGQ